MTKYIKIAAGVLGSLLLGGCAVVPKDAGFGDVQKAVMERTGQRLQWDRGTDADKRVALAVSEMLKRELSADDAVQVALLNNQGLQATYEDLGIAQAELVEAGLLRNPTFSAEFRLPSYRAFPFDFNITQGFLDLLVLPLRKRAAGASFEAAKMRVTHEVLNMAASAKASFYRAQGAAQLLEMRRNIVEASDAAFDAARRLHEAGNISDLAIANEQALYEQAKVDLAKAEREARDAREELSALMGVWGNDTAWTIALRLPQVPAAEIDMTALESLAISRRTDLAAARQEVEVAAGTLGLTGYMAFGSDASIGAHLSRETDGATSVGPNISVPLPIFNQGQAAVAAATVRLRQGQRRYAALAVQVRSEVRRARNDLLAARDLAEHYVRVIVPLRRQIVDQNQLHYNAMRIGVFEFLQSKQAEIDAGREYVEAIKTYWVARAELERAVGGHLPSTLPTTLPTTQPAPATLPAPAVHQHHFGG